MIIKNSPIPYQGSKRRLAPLIHQFLPKNITSFYEPFAGSAALSIYLAVNTECKKFIIGDNCEPLIELLELIVTTPSFVIEKYTELWGRGVEKNSNCFIETRNFYNTYRDPVSLLYLICRCVKNAVRFNTKGYFTQSADKRRTGMHPKKMEQAIYYTSECLKGKTEFRVGDWENTLLDADENSFIYMDPPYLGTSVGSDKRYHTQLSQSKLIEGLLRLQKRRVPFALSYDGKTGNKEYGPPLPEYMGLNRLLLHAGRSAQATLNGIDAETYESLYTWGYNVPPTREPVYYTPRAKEHQLSLA